jgi:hypothetical protein
MSHVSENKELRKFSDMKSVSTVGYYIIRNAVGYTDQPVPLG